MNNVEGRELRIIQAAATAITSIVVETASTCGKLSGNDRTLNRAAGIRGGCSSMLGAIIMMSSLVGLNKAGKLCVTDDSDSDPHDHCNEGATMFIAVLMGKMCSEMRKHSKEESALVVEFSPQVLADAVKATEAICGPLDGKIDPGILEVARETRDMGNQAIAMLDRLIAAGKPN